MDVPSKEQRRDLNATLWILFRHGDMAYFQYENGAIDEPRLRSALGPLIGILNVEYVKERWLTIRSNFVPEYRNYMDRLIEEVNGDEA